MPDTKYSALFKKVKELQKEGKLSQRVIAKELGMNRDAVGRYFKLDAYPRNFSEPIDEKNIALLFANFGKMVNEVPRRYGEK
ncbi:winged helix-turn-helix domain-containing protein (plasmid) [Flammeovirga pectinis]|uniref:Winged helix-turn-helix domain-containing protein n=1 Tax=Flammeovirga pectinis TaxID=2494373 RepID=A0A3S9PBL5_9BACT|nr:winged helix-turn-helix domain-containing protein [Flammeovirga pectinis]AZQ65608.1 winged helix-turn-helix domain-containing protein [Flammeovirga pectinis]